MEAWKQREKFKEAQTRIRNHGGRVNLFQRNVIMPPNARPGLKVWAAIDCLVNYAGYAFFWEVT